MASWSGSIAARSNRRSARRGRRSWSGRRRGSASGRRGRRSAARPNSRIGLSRGFKPRFVVARPRPSRRCRRTRCLAGGRGSPATAIAGKPQSDAATLPGAKPEAVPSKPAPAVTKATKPDYRPLWPGRGPEPLIPPPDRALPLPAQDARLAAAPAPRQVVVGEPAAPALAIASAELSPRGRIDVPPRRELGNHGQAMLLRRSRGSVLSSADSPVPASHSSTEQSRSLAITPRRLTETETRRLWNPRPLPPTGTPSLRDEPTPVSLVSADGTRRVPATVDATRRRVDTAPTLSVSSANRPLPRAGVDLLAILPKTATVEPESQRTPSIRGLVLPARTPETPPRASPCRPATIRSPCGAAALGPRPVASGPRERRGAGRGSPATTWPSAVWRLNWSRAAHGASSNWRIFSIAWTSSCCGSAT